MAWTHIRLLLIALLIHTNAIGQVCVVNSTEPPPAYFPDGTPIAWPKTGVYSAPQYVGYVDWFIYCGNVYGVNGFYFSCPSNSLSDDIGTAVLNWNSASSSNGSTVSFNQTSDTPTNTGSCSPTPCFPQFTPFIEFIQEQQADLDVTPTGPGTVAYSSWASHDYGCQSPLCPYQVGPYMRLSSTSTVFSMDITNDHFMTVIAAHEVGHTFALGECDSCDASDTVMKAGFTLNDPTSGRTAPGFCDNQQVSASDVAMLPSFFRRTDTLLARGSSSAAKP